MVRASRRQLLSALGMVSATFAIAFAGGCASGSPPAGGATQAGGTAVPKASSTGATAASVTLRAHTASGAYADFRGLEGSSVGEQNLAVIWTGKATVAQGAKTTNDAMQQVLDKPPE